jgi:hypothetical protein
VSQTFGSRVSVVLPIRLSIDSKHEQCTAGTDQSSLLRPKRLSDRSTLRPAVKPVDLVAGSDDG